MIRANPDEYLCRLERVVGFNHDRGDERERALFRAAASGDAEAAEALILTVARSGRYFTGRGHVDLKRTLWVRVLGFLGWSGAAEFQRMVAEQAPPRSSWQSGSMRIDGPLEPWHLLAQVGPVSRLGPDVSRDAGLEVMGPIALAAVRAVAHLVPGADEEAFARMSVAWSEALRKRQAALRELRLGADGERMIDLREQDRVALERLSAVSRAGVVHEGRVATGRGSNAGELAGAHALAAWDALTGVPARHASDGSRLAGEAYFHAAGALAFECEARRGAVTGGGRIQIGYSDRYGVRPSRGCAIVGGRELRRATLGPALVVVALRVAEDPGDPHRA